MNRISWLFFLSVGVWMGACQSDKAVSDVQSIATYYQEPHRPQFHFSPDSMWMNDPNGMFYHEGEYHLFYQYYPDSNVWGPMHWAHAVSTDLVQWEHLPIALYPDTLGYIFSGSAVVDAQNTSGLGQEGATPIVAIYTYHDPIGERTGSNTFQSQGLAYSLDKGRTWTKYEDNPVLPNPGIRDFRDPKVSWHEPTQQWVMILAVWDHVNIYTSPNLLDWTFASEFGDGIGTHGGVWECPDLFPLTLEGETKWVMLVSIGSSGPNGGSGTQYFIGDFDGKTFSIDPALSAAFGMKEANVPDGMMFEDFEARKYKDWTPTGEAFGKRPAKGALNGQQEVTGYEGKRLVNSFLNGDQATGTLTSPAFTIESTHINFLIGGGHHVGKTCMNLMIDGEQVRTATGKASEKLDWYSWDVAEFKGKTAQLQIVDDHQGGWGHINVDQIMFAEAAATPMQEKTIWLDYGKDNYAGVTWANVPEADGRRLFIGWMSNWQYATKVPTERWRSAMTLPRSLELIATANGPRLRTLPVRELTPLLSPASLEEALPLGRIRLTLAPSSGKSGIALTNAEGDRLVIGYDTQVGQAFVDRTQAGKKGFSSDFPGRHYMEVELEEGQLSMDIWLDVSSVEIFAQDGKAVMTEIVFPQSPFSQIDLLEEGGKVTVEESFTVSRTWPVDG